MTTTANTDRPRIGELLVRDGIISEAQLAEALARQKEKGGKIVEILIDLGYLDARTFAVFLSRQPGVASINVLNYEIPKHVVDLVPAEYALKHEIMPLDKLGKDLTVGMACPLDARSIKELEAMTGLRVRPLLCSMQDIRVALNRYYIPQTPVDYDTRKEQNSDTPSSAGLRGRRKEDKEVNEVKKAESGVRFEGVIQLVRKIHMLPALPETVAQVRDAMENPNGDATSIAAIIERDPAVAAKVLSLANSAAYGFSHHVSSVDMAVRLLGLREIFSVVLSSAVIDYFKEGKCFDYKAFWRRCMFAGNAARIIARHCGRPSASGIFAAGLLHDLGRVVFAQVAPERYKSLDQTQRDNTLIAQEEELFGIAHPEAGYMLADCWELPTELQEPIRFHNDFRRAEAEPQLTTIVALAALMADIYGRITRENAAAYAAECKELLDALHLQDQQFILILAETAKTVKQELN